MKGEFIGTTKCSTLLRACCLLGLVFVISILLRINIVMPTEYNDWDDVLIGLYALGFWYEYGDLFTVIKIASIIAVCYFGGKFYLMLCWSYCDVYEYGITGKAVWEFSKGMPIFDLRYDEIMNITQTWHTLIIQTRHEKLKVMAFRNRQAVFTEIRDRSACERGRANTRW